MISCVEINPKIPATASVIWLHGLGADGNDFVPVAKQLNFASTRFIFPHAPMRPITINGGYKMRAWYDIFSLDFENYTDDEIGIRESEKILRQLINNEIEKNIPNEKIFLAGFSQGGAIALHTGLRYEKKLGGIIALSTYLPLPEKLIKESNQANQETPILMAHGTMDPIIPIKYALKSKHVLENLNHKITWHEYPMAHTVSMAEIKAIKDWLEIRCSN